MHGRGSFFYSSVRSTDTVNRKTETSVTNTGRFGDSWVGVNYRFKEDDATPGIIPSTEAALWERFGTDVVFLKSFIVGMTAYKAIDPIIFSCDAGYRISLQRHNGEHDVRPGGFLWVSPSVTFSANDRVTLATGFRWSGREADRHYGNKQPEDFSAVVFRACRPFRWTLCRSTLVRMADDWPLRGACVYRPMTL